MHLSQINTILFIFASRYLFIIPAKLFFPKYFKLVQVIKFKFVERFVSFFLSLAFSFLTDFFSMFFKPKEKEKKSTERPSRAIRAKVSRLPTVTPRFVPTKISYNFNNGKTTFSKLILKIKYIVYSHPALVPSKFKPNEEARKKHGVAVKSPSAQKCPGSRRQLHASSVQKL